MAIYFDHAGSLTVCEFEVFGDQPSQPTPDKLQPPQQPPNQQPTTTEPSPPTSFSKIMIQLGYGTWTPTIKIGLFFILLQ